MGNSIEPFHTQPCYLGTCWVLYLTFLGINKIWKFEFILEFPVSVRDLKFPCKLTRKNKRQSVYNLLKKASKNNIYKNCNIHKRSINTAWEKNLQRLFKEKENIFSSSTTTHSQSSIKILFHFQKKEIFCKVYANQVFWLRLYVIIPKEFFQQSKQYYSKWSYSFDQ